MRYFIIGFKNSGKTTFGRRLADRLGMKFIDLDEYIEARKQKSIPELYSLLGEEKFRHTEWKALKKVVQNDNVVIATGGGAPCNCDNMNLMEKYGEVIYLKVSNETLVNRLKTAAKDRPIVLGKSEEELRMYIADLKRRCEFHYLRASYILDGDKADVEEIAGKIGKV